MLSTRPGLPGSPGRVPALALAGALLAAATTWSAGVVGPPGFARPFTRWGGLLAPTGVWPDHDRWPGLVLAGALLGLVTLWVVTVHVARRDHWTTRDVWLVGGGWAAPLVLGPPALSNDVFSYVAQGAVAATGADPTRVSPMALGWRSPLVQAVDPRWQQTPSPYGPLATLLQREAVEAAGGHPVLAVVVLRLVALVSVAGIAALASSLARAAGRGGTRPVVLLLTWANPLLLLHVVAAVHLEGLLVVLVLLAVRAAQTRTAAGDVVALVAATAAAGVKLPVGGVVLAAVGVALVARGVGHRARVWRALGALAVVTTTYAALCVVAGSGWQLLAVVRAPAAGRTPAAPATLLATGLRPLDWLGLTDRATLETLGRGVLALGAVVVVAWLVATVARRPLPLTVGLALLALAAGSPVLYPWYLVWSVPLLATVVAGAWRRRLVLLSAVGSLMTVQGLTHLETWVVASGVVVAASAALVVTEAPLVAPARGLLRRWTVGWRRVDHVA